MVMRVILRGRCWTFPPPRHTGRMTAATYTYDPWGNTTTSTGALANTNPWHYAGSWTDAATGYLKLGARYYNPTTGRFTQPDPSGVEANTYNYASFNPVNSADPSGLDGVCDYYGIAVGFVVSIVFAPFGLVGDGLVTTGIGLALSNQCENPQPYVPEYSPSGQWQSEG
jgi:RHS repeat-associated protein